MGLFSLQISKYKSFFFLETFCKHRYGVVNRHRFDADPELDPTFHFNADPDPVLLILDKQKNFVSIHNSAMPFSLA
jgi:hypothetical protein